MEYLAEEHQDLAKEGLQEIRGKLCLPQQDVLERLTSKPEEFRFGHWFRRAEEYSYRNLQTARLIWEYLLGKCNDKQQKIAVLNKLFHVQLATGPWDEALKTAQNVFNETMAFHVETASQKNSAGQSLADPVAVGEYIFEACMNLASIQRLQKKIQEAEDLYRNASVAAASIRDLDKETLAKVHQAICLLDRGELKKATETYFKPLLPHKDSWSKYTRAIYLQSYGNACRSAANWGKAKKYLREALELAKEMKNTGLVSSCCGDLGNVFRSEGRYRDAERLHRSHYNIALKRGDTHGLAIACGNIGFLKFYNPEEFDDSLVYQFIEYSLADQVGDFARMGISFNKIGKLYTTLGYYEEAVELFRIAVTQAQKAKNVAGEGMAWGNLGTVYRALEQYEDAIECHIKYRDNAERRMDIGGLAIMQHQLAMDYYLSGNLPEAESSILSAFQTLERIRAQIGEEDESKISNFEKNQAEAYNLLQVVLVAQKKYKEAFVLADASRGRSLSDIVQGRLFGSNASETNSKYLNEEFLTESFNSLLEVGRQLSTSLVLYSVVQEFDQAGTALKWVYAWVLEINGSLHFNKTRLQGGAPMKVELNDEIVVSLSRSMGLQSQSRGVSEILKDEISLRCSQERNAALPISTKECDDVLEALHEYEDMFSSHWECKSDKSINLIDHTLAKVPHKGTEKHETSGRDSEILSSITEDNHIREKEELEHHPANSSTAQVLERQESMASKHSTGNPSTKTKVSLSSNGTDNAQSTKLSHIPKSQEASNVSSCVKNYQDNRPFSTTSEKNESNGKTFFVNSKEDMASMEVQISHSCAAADNKSMEFSFSNSEKQSLDSVNSTNIPMPTSSLFSENSEENDRIDVSPNPQQNAFHVEKKVGEGYPLPTKDCASEDAIPVVPENCVAVESDKLHSTDEAENATPLTSKPETVNSTELEEGFNCHLECKDILPGKPNNVGEDHSLSIEASSKENEIEEESTRLDYLETVNDYHLECNPNAGNSQLNNLPDDPELTPWQSMLNQVHKILIEPIAHFLPRKGQSRRVTFIPQDFLLKVPFAALQEAPGYRYLFEDFVISTSPAIHFLNLACDSARKPEQNTSSLSVLSVGNPVMPLKELPQLPSAEHEARMICEIIHSSDSELFIGAQAKKRDVVAAMPKHTILHFATHAVIDDSDSYGDFSMKGLVVLSKSGNDCDGLLTAEEVRGIKLNAELVILSCCETGLGKVTGDGVLGLSRAFLAAGAACVIVTLWKIDDESAFKLMTSFYREYKKCRDAAVSLQRAMRLLQAKADTKSPIHWAAFSIVGTSGKGLYGR